MRQIKTRITGRYYIIMKMKLKKIWSIILGLACGLINGFLGSGGGIIAVQSMEKLGKDSKKSHATALLVIMPLSIISAFVYYRNGSIVFDGNTWALLGGGAIGGLVGAMLLGKASTKVIDCIFTVIIIASGVWMLL